MPNSVFALALAVVVSIQAAPATPPLIVFVCEHGAAKSLIATAYFNKMAAERRLSARATFRGVDPQDDLSVRAVAGLKKDGFTIPAARPRSRAACT